jgi:hypothetical protein
MILFPVIPLSAPHFPKWPLEFRLKLLYSCHLCHVCYMPGHSMPFSLLKQSYRVSKMKHPDFIFNEAPWFWRCFKNNYYFLILNVSCVMHQFKFPPKFLATSRATVGTHKTCSQRRVLIFKIKLVALCDWYLSIISPYIYIYIYIYIHYFSRIRYNQGVSL